VPDETEAPLTTWIPATSKPTMATEVHRISGQRVRVTTRDKYDNTNSYTFRRSADNSSVWEPETDYTWTVIEALTEAGYVVNYQFDDLHVTPEDVFDDVPGEER